MMLRVAMAAFFWVLFIGNGLLIAATVHSESYIELDPAMYRIEQGDSGEQVVRVHVSKHAPIATGNVAGFNLVLLFLLAVTHGIDQARRGRTASAGAP